jgi:hypothetical protein
MPPDIDNFTAGWPEGTYSPPTLDEFSASWPIVGPVNTTHTVTGWQATQFGGARYVEQFEQASGFRTGSFGTPFGTNAYSPESIAATASFGRPTTPTFTLSQVGSFASTRFGTAYGYIPFMFGPVNQSVSVSGQQTVRFGEPSGTVSAIVLAQGFASPQYGAPTSRRIFAATSIGLVTTLAPPSVATRHHASGIRSLSCGVPATTAGYLVSGVMRTRYGSPRANNPGARVAYGWQTVRTGVPQGRIQPAGLAVAGAAITVFGPAVSENRHRVLGGAHTSRFGRATVRRTPTC